MVALRTDHRELIKEVRKAKKMKENDDCHWESEASIRGNASDRDHAITSLYWSKQHANRTAAKQGERAQQTSEGVYGAKNRRKRARN